MCLSFYGLIYFVQSVWLSNINVIYFDFITSILQVTSMHIELPYIENMICRQQMPLLLASAVIFNLGYATEIQESQNANLTSSQLSIGSSSQRICKWPLCDLFALYVFYFAIEL